MESVHVPNCLVIVPNPKQRIPFRWLYKSMHAKMVDDDDDTHTEATVTDEKMQKHFKTD